MTAFDRFVKNKYQPVFHDKRERDKINVAADVKAWTIEGCRERLTRLIAEAKTKEEVSAFWDKTVNWVQACHNKGFASIAEACLDAMSQAWDEVGEPAYIKKFAPDTVQQSEEWF